MCKRVLSFTICFLFIAASQSFGDDIESRLKALEQTLQIQGDTIREQQKVIQELKAQLDATKKGVATQGELAKGEFQTTDVNIHTVDKSWKFTGLFGGSNLANPNISLVLDTFGYYSNIKQGDLPKRGIPGYTTDGLTNGKGFNIDSAELAFYAPIDPYFNLYATIPITEDGIELEEAYFLTTSLPYGLQAKGGKFKSGLGRINGQHKHVWDFADLPLVYRAFMEGEGITEKGVQLTYLPGLPFYTLFGIEVLQGQNATLFGPDARSGPHAFTAFAKTSLDIGDNSTILFGPSVITGSTRTTTVAADTEFQGTSALFDWEMTYKWKPSKTRSFTLQSEYLYRGQKGDLTDTAAGITNPLKRAQDGFYVQGMYQLDRWRIGARYDRLDLFKKDFILSGTRNDFGSNPWRASAAVDFNPSEFSRFRLQYNYDRSAGDGRVNNEVFLEAIFGIGAHGAHAF